MPFESNVDGVATDDDEKDPSVIPEDVKEFIEKLHKAQRESRPDESWRITPPEKEPPIAPYKQNEEAEDADPALKFAEGGVVPEKSEDAPGIIDKLRQYVMAKGGLGAADDREYQIANGIDTSSGTVKNYDEGGEIPDAPMADFDVDGGDSQTAKMGGTPKSVTPAVAPDPIAESNAALDEWQKTIGQQGEGTGPSVAAPKEPAAPATPPPVSAAPSAPALTDQDYMDRANKLLGLNPEQQAGFMKLLGDRSQKAQIGAGIAGIGDAIASGGTLGKVNPGALARSEDLIQGKEKAGIEGMQTIRGNQEKANELAQKLQAQDPNSPLSKYAQKAYGSIGKKLGLDLSHASAALIGDVAGKGVEELNTEYEGDLKKMGLTLQKEQVEATIGNQKAERNLAQQSHQEEAAKTLADRGIFKTIANAIPGTAGHQATKVLERAATGEPESTGPVTVNSRAEYNALPSGTHYVDSYGTHKVKK